MPTKIVKEIVKHNNNGEKKSNCEWNRYELQDKKFIAIVKNYFCNYFLNFLANFGLFKGVLGAAVVLEQGEYYAVLVELTIFIVKFYIIMCKTN